MLENKEAQALSEEELDEVSGGGYKGYEDYYVKPHDTFWGIAVSHQTTMEALGILNNIPYPYFIHPGQHLLVPKHGHH